MDTDVLVAAIRSKSGASRLWLKSVLQRRDDVLLSVPLVLQYEEVLTRPEHLAYAGASEDQIVYIINALCAVGIPIKNSFLWRPTLKDPDDEMVLETAINGSANLLLSFNTRDFAGAEKFGVTVSRPGDAWRKFKGG